MQHPDIVVGLLLLRLDGKCCLDRWWLAVCISSGQNAKEFNVNVTGH